MNFAGEGDCRRRVQEEQKKRRWRLSPNKGEGSARETLSVPAAARPGRASSCMSPCKEAALEGGASVMSRQVSCSTVATVARLKPLLSLLYFSRFLKTT